MQVVENQFNMSNWMLPDVTRNGKIAQSSKDRNTEHANDTLLNTIITNKCTCGDHFNTVFLQRPKASGISYFSADRHTVYPTADTAGIENTKAETSYEPLHFSSSDASLVSPTATDNHRGPKSTAGIAVLTDDKAHYENANIRPQ